MLTNTAIFKSGKLLESFLLLVKSFNHQVILAQTIIMLIKNLSEYNFVTMADQLEFMEAAMLLGNIIKVAPTNTLLTYIVFSL